MVATSIRARRVAVAVCAVVACHAGLAQEPAPVAPVAVAAPRPVGIRVQWGGGQPRAWSGTVALVPPTGGAVREIAWRTLSEEPDAAALVHADGGTIVVHQPRPIAGDGVEITVPDVRGWRLVAALGPAGADATARLDVAVDELFAAEAAQPLDADGNRLVVRPAPGESLRAAITTAAGDATAFHPGERVRITVDPLLPARADGAAAPELRLRISARDDGAEVVAQAATLVPRPEPAAGDPADAGSRRPTLFDSVAFDLVLPRQEGVWNVELQAVEASGLGWTRTLATRSLQVVTLAAQRPPADSAAWRVVYELDPGNPRLHERLRRLPGVGLPSVPLPAVPLPSLTRPTLPRLPQLPVKSVPLPPVPVPHVPPLAAMVPRLSGLLAAGHSRVEPHPLGPMLQLPPAETADAPTWEGIVIAGARPGVPHVVEVECPSDQNATVGVNVLELDRTGSLVESRHSGGFEVRREAAAGPARLHVHRFVFWPATRHPVVLLSNQSDSLPALVGHVRILAGPARLPPAAAASGRPVHAFLSDPRFADFGAADDHASRVAAVARSAEAIAAQGAAGAMVVVHAGGAALWPSRCSLEAPRWGSGADQAGATAETPDVLAAACRIYEREGLRFVPALACDAPLAALEAELARGGPAASGIACVGRDGRPRRVGRLATVHYNVLDPRVQRAVEDLVRELAGRIRGSAAIDGVALVLSHDGWLHLPGVAWGLDDATFARFRVAAGVAEPAAGEERFAARAALVEGPARDRWLEWRAAETARFHARLADILAEHGDRWSLYLTPTTLLSDGPIAERLRPSLATTLEAGAVLREAGLDPVRSTAHRRVVFLAPQVHGDDGGGARALAAAGNAAAVHAIKAAARRGVIVLEESRPLDVKTMVPHGPFGSAPSAGPCRVVAVPTGAAAGRSLATAFSAADAEAVFDARLGVTLPARRTPDRSAIEALPPSALVPVAGLPAPLAVRTAPGDGVTWVHVVNSVGVPVRASLTLGGQPTDVMDLASGAALEADAGTVAVDLPAWGMRALRVGGVVSVAGARLDYAPGVVAAVEKRVANLVRRCAALDSPVPLDLLDNPGFEIAGAVAGPWAAAFAGWDVVEARRGSVTVVTGRDGTGRGASFTSTNGLSTLRSNPFSAPASGRMSVAAWLRVRDGDPQPPLRVALEGVLDDREYYRFAAVGGLTTGRPLTGEWQQFVLQVDDLPDGGLESLRVRFDLLGPGTVEIDDVRVFDLAFSDAERQRLSRQIAGLEAAVAAGDVGACLTTLDGHWPRYLEAHVPVPPAPAPPPAVAEPRTPKPAERTGVLDRMWKLWQ